MAQVLIATQRGFGSTTTLSVHQVSSLEEDYCMIKFKRLLVAAVASAASVIVVAGLSVSDIRGAEDKQCCDKESVKYSQEIWKELLNRDLVGPNMETDTPYKGQAPHGAILESITTQLDVGGNFLGFGGHNSKIVLKRNYGGEGVSIDAVSKDRAKFLKSITVMFKREKGYDPENNDWFWAKYKPDGSLATNPKGMPLAGRVMKGKDKGCIACHSAVKDNDYLYGKQK